MSIHRSAFKEHQAAIQCASDQSREDAFNEVLAWLGHRRANPAFAEVETALRAEFFEPVEGGDAGTER